MNGVEVTGLRVVLDGRPVLDGVDVTVTEGSWVAVIGPNGAGKSTLLRAVTGLVAAAAGEVLVAGRPLRGLKPRDRAQLIAYAPQDPRLPEEMAVREYALLGRSPYISYLGRERAADREAVAEVLERLELTGFADRPLGHLSGGERQRVVLARALVQRPRVLLLDEPTSALDLGHQQQVLELVDTLRLADGLTVVTTLHDLSLAAQYADELVLLAAGRVAAVGPAADVLTEQAVAEHFGAKVRVVVPASGRPVLSLVRP